MPDAGVIPEFDLSKPSTTVASPNAVPEFDLSKPSTTVPEDPGYQISGIESIPTTGSPDFPYRMSELTEKEGNAIAFNPLIPLPRFTPNPQDSTVKSAGKALYNVGAGFPEFLESPVGMGAEALSMIPGVGGMISRRLLAAGFAADMARKVPEVARAAGTASVEGNKQEKIEADLSLITQIGMPAFLARAAVSRTKPKVVNKPAPAPGPAALLGEGTRFAVEPEGTATDIQNLSPAEQAELDRSANARSRQTESGQSRVVNTVAAGLEQEPTPTAKEVIRSNGANWYRKGDYWITDKPAPFFEKTTLRAGRGNMAEDAIVADLEAKEQAGEAAKSKDKNLTGQQKIIEDVTGVSEPQKQEQAKELIFREAYERKLNQRWASPPEEYGPNGALSMAQQQKLDAFAEYLPKEADDWLHRLYASLSKVRPKYAYDITLLDMLKKRLGIEGEEPPPGELGGPTPPLPAPPTRPQLGGPNAPIPVRGAEKIPVGEAPGDSPALGQGATGTEKPAQAQGGAEVSPETEVAPGFTRLYRGEGEPNLALPEWAKTNAGQWFSSIRAKAEEFQKLRAGKLRHLDVPTSTLKQYEAGFGNAPDEYLIPKVVQDNLKKAKLNPGGALKDLSPELQALHNKVAGPAGFAAKEIGWTFDGVDEFPSVNSKDMSDEDKATLKAAGLKPMMAFTDRRVGSPTEGTTTMVPVDAKYPDIVKAIKDKIEQVVKAKAEKEPPAYSTTIWPQFLAEHNLFEVNPDGSLEPPPKGPGAIFSDASLKKTGQDKSDVIQRLNRYVEEGRDPVSIAEVIKNSRSANAALYKISMLPKDKASVEAARVARNTPPPKPNKAQQAWNRGEAFQSGKKPVQTPEEIEMRKWMDADITRAASQSQNSFKLPGDAERLAKANAFLARMKKKYGSDDPYDKPGMERAKMLRDRERARNAAREKNAPPPAPPAPERYGPKENDSVVKVVEGKPRIGTVFISGGGFMVKVAIDGRLLAEPWDASWQPLSDQNRPGAVPDKPYTPDEFFNDLKLASKSKRQPLLDRLQASLERIAPGLFERARAVVEKIRNGERQKGNEPRDYKALSGYSDVDNGTRIIESLAEAAKQNEDYHQESARGSREGAAAALEKAQQMVKHEEEVQAGTYVPPTPEEVATKSIEDSIKSGSRINDDTVKASPKAKEMLAQAQYKRKENGLWVAPGDPIYGRKIKKPGDGGGPSSSPFSPKFGITPQPPDWLRKLAEEEVAPYVKKGVDVAKATADLIVNALSPETHAKPEHVDILFKTKGEKEKFMTRAADAMQKWRTAIDLIGTSKQIQFIDRMKKGGAQTNPELQQLALVIRTWDNKLHELAKEFNPDLNYLDNHYRVLWKVIPGTAGKKGLELENILSRRPWRGSRGFNLQHTLESMSEGIAMGGEPVTYNPVEMFLLHAQDVMKFVSANRAWQDLKKIGSAVYVERGQDRPPGYVRINDTIARQYFKTKDTKPGEWYVEEGTARMINNYLSHDFIRQGKFGPTGRFLVDLKNVTTAVELGFSPFHAVFETNEAVASALGLSVAKMATPGFGAEGIKEFLQALPGTVPIVGGFVKGGAVRNVASEGRDIINYAKNPEDFAKNYPDAYKYLKAKYPAFESMVDLLFSGGGMVAMKDDYHIQAARKFREALNERGTVHGNVGMVKYGVPAAAQQMLKPLFETYIPRLKVGTFARELSFELARRSDDIAAGKITPEQIARQTWAFVDDRFGELNWDNLYWNRTFKSLNQLLFRSVTWKLGNTRGFGKAGRDFVQFLKPGGDHRVTQPMAWLVGMALVTTIQSTIISKIFTGKYPWELAAGKGPAEEMRNLTFPRIDKNDPSQRVSIATYWKDLIHLAHSPTDYLHSSMTGELGRFWDMWNNRDFYGTQVYGPDDPWYKRWEDKSKHLIPVPFSFSSAYKAYGSGASPMKSAASFFGYNKAPYYVSHSHAEQLADQLVRDSLPQGSRTKEQYQKSVSENKIVAAVKRGDTTFDEAENRGLIKPARSFQLQQHLDDTYLQHQVRRLSADNIMKVWNKASPDERLQIKDEALQKVYSNQELDDDIRERYILRIEEDTKQAGQPAPVPSQTPPEFDMNKPSRTVR